jgi:hypothetical protein
LADSVVEVQMIAMMLVMVACLAAWAHVVHMLDGARERLALAMVGDVRQGGGWMPSSSPLERRASASGSGRAFNRA